MKCGNKIIIFIMVFVVIGLTTANKIKAQGVAINTSGADAHPSSMLDVQSTSAGLLIPRMTQGERNLIGSPATSLLIYQTDNSPGYYYFDGSNWVQLFVGEEVDPTWNGDANTISDVGRSGNVGIGTTSPAFKLDVRNGAHVATNSNSAPFIVSRNYKTTNHEEVRVGVDDQNLYFHYINDESANKINFRLQNTDTESGGGANASDYTVMTLSANSTEGRVGIGTTSPAQKLHVAGNIRATSLASGANGAIVRTNTSGDMAITNFTGNTSDILLGNNSFGSVAAAGGVISSCGTANYVPKMVSNTQMNCSQIFDNGTNVGIGTSAPSAKLHVNGDVVTARQGTAGTYNSTQVQGIWSIGDAYRIDETNNDFGTQFGIVYAHTNAGTTTTKLPIAGWGHQILFTSNGIRNVSISLSSGHAYFAGNVGIGTTAPAQLLELYKDNADVAIRFHDPGNYHYAIGIDQSDAGKFKINYGSGVGDAAHFVMTTAGNVGIGTTSPVQKLHVSGGHITVDDGMRYSFIHQNSHWAMGRNIHNDAPGSGGDDIMVQGYGSSENSFQIISQHGVSGSFTYNNRFQVNFDNGYVGIGTSSPSAQLHTTGTVRFANYTNGFLQVDGTGNLSVGSGSDYFTAGDGLSWSGNTLNNIWKENGSHIYNGNSGNVGVGTTSPTGKLTVQGGGTNALFFEYGGTYDAHMGLTGYDLEIYSADDMRIKVNEQNSSGVFEIEDEYNGNTWVRINNNGNVGINTTTPSEKLEVSGNAKATGYIVAGNATTTSTTRYGEQTIMWDAGYSFDANGYIYINIGSISLPTGVTSININTIAWECDGAHEDGNEDHGVWVGIGSSTSTTYYGWGTSVNNGYHYIDWHYINDGVSINVNSTNNNVYIRLEDDDCITCGGDRTILYNLSLTVYYSFSVGLQNGDIAASGRVYANNTTAIGDLAEYFEYDGPVVPGFVVSYVPGSDNEYVRCSEPYSNHITGVISENPSVVLNSPDQGPPLALAGRVKVKLVDSDELIKGGDFLTSSDQLGLAQKATRPGPVIGYAVKNQKPGDDFVEVLLQPGKFYFSSEYEEEFEIDPEAGKEKRKGKW